MTTPVFDRIRSIPLNVQRNIPMAVDSEDNSGFPFDREFDRERDDDSFRSQLDDIANRHPELAEHFEGFPFRTDSLGRRSRPPRPSDESEFRRFGGRPFGSARFERFGFPFGRDPFEEEFDRGEESRPHQSEQSQETPQQNQQQQQQQPEERKERGRRQNIQPSNTVDLGQKQEPVNDRNQRSMSAPPPDNRSGQQRYVSSINIPINRDGGIGESKPQAQPQPQQQEKPANKPMERVIPIHVEGRDEPVMPKHTGSSFGQSPQPERVYTQSPQPERIFGHRPERFTQYVGREPPRQFTSGPEWHHPGYAKQETTPPPEAMRQQQQKFQQQQQVPPQKPQEQVPPPQQQQQPPKSSSCNNPIDIIQSIQKDVSELMGQVEKFDGVPRDKQYLYLDEMLTRNLIKLDNVDTQGQENIRQARKEAIKCIERCIGILDQKAAANVASKEQPNESNEEKMEVESQNEEQQPQTVTEEKPAESQSVEKMEVEGNKESENVTEAKVEEKAEIKEKTETEPKVEQQPSSEEKMEGAVESAVSVEIPSESSQLEKVEEKPAEEVTSTQEGGETASQEENKDEQSEDKTEKKKGKKKVVK